MLGTHGIDGLSFNAESSDVTRSPFDKSSTAEEVTTEFDLTGKTALITGCNAGIGFETMRVLVMRGAKVLGLARTMEKATKACVRATSGASKGSAIPFACEQTDFASVAACADTVLLRHTVIDMLICNAGAYFIPELELVDGLEMHFVVNHLSHFILVNRLLECVKSARQGRIVVVGSNAGFFLAPDAGIEFDNLLGQRYYDHAKMYGQSKLANALFTRELARRLHKSHVTANVVHPGFVTTDKVLEFSRRMHIAIKEGDFKTVEQGAATSCYVATNPSLAKINGAYFEDCGIVTPGGHMRNDQMAAELWNISEEITGRFLKNSI